MTTRDRGSVFHPVEGALEAPPPPIRKKTPTTAKIEPVTTDNMSSGIQKRTCNPIRYSYDSKKTPQNITVVNNQYYEKQSRSKRRQRLPENAVRTSLLISHYLRLQIPVIRRLCFYPKRIIITRENASL